MAEFPLAVVTGAAHRVGRLLALALASRGYAILLHYHASAEQASETAREIEALGVPAYPVQADLATDAGIAALLSAMESKLLSPSRSLKVLVNSAAVMNRANVPALAPADWDSTFDLNLRAPFFLAQGAAQRMPEGGLIVNVTDAGAGKPWTGFPAYTVSKAALESLTRLLAKAYAPHIRVNAIAPGLALPSDRVPPEEWDRLVKRLPLGRPASPLEIASALEYLLANESVTGQTIVVDGGYSLI
jgi:NAD(P)-dependent dehydrogenase (short-subunit alcohol dehydrogenase family)